MTAWRAAATGARRAAARSGRAGDGRPPGIGPARGRRPRPASAITARNAGWSRSGCPTPASPQSRRVMVVPSPRTLPVEVAMDQRVREAAGRQRGEPRRELGHEGAERRAIAASSGVAFALDERRDRLERAGPRQSGSPRPSSSAVRVDQAAWRRTRPSTIASRSASGAS